MERASQAKQVAAGEIGDHQRIAVALVGKHELGLDRNGLRADKGIGLADVNLIGCTKASASDGSLSSRSGKEPLAPH